MPLAGRGTHYTPLRRAVEGALGRAYGDGWPARIAHGLGWQRRIRVLEQAVVAPAWPGAAPPLRVVFASDWHAGPTTHPAFHERVATAIADAKPDLLLLGGDFVFLDAKYIDRLVPLLRRIEAPGGKMAVLGNHDLWADDRRIVRALESAGVDVLINRTARVAPPFAHVSVCGLDDPWVGSPDARATFAGAGAVRILLMHAPSGLLAAHASGEAFDVAFCGHTHGGHLALPFGVPVVAPGRLARAYPHGRFAVGPTGCSTLLVSRGIGGIEVPFRTFADPDVIACTLSGG
jgi:predicted MPP superfamily phosphohydrolase